MTTLESGEPLTSAPAESPRSCAIVVNDVSKKFRLYRERATSLKETITARRGRRARFDDFWALRNVSLSIPKGSTFGLIGHNGSGKSTLLRLMASIHRPTSGTIHTEGRISALLELGAGFHPELSGRENIYLNGSILGLTRREVRAVVDEIIEFSGLEEFVDSPVKHYSSGMYVRLGFAIAVHVKPDIVMIDEVIAVGDEEFQRRCLDHLFKLRRSGVTLVMVSHGSSMMEQLCDEIAWLDHGHLQKVGPAADVVRAYIDVVNAAENERRTADGTVTIAESDAEPGTPEDDDGAIQVLCVELLDAGGNPIATASTGEPLTIRVRYRARGELDSPVFRLRFVTEGGVTIAEPTTRSGDVDTNVGPGDGHIDYLVDQLQLLPGSWQLSVIVTDSHMLRTYDRFEESFAFRVQPGSSAERYGLVDMHGRWRVND